MWRVYSVPPEASDETLRRASVRGWEVASAQCVRLTSGRGRVARVLPRNDAARLYEDMHRRPVAVMYDGKPMIRTHPEASYRDDRAVKLTQFVRYKCFVMNTAAMDARGWESAFDKWLQQATCDGRSDPRILPFHIFAMKGSYDLDLSRGRQRFRQSHKRRDRALVDGRRRRWSPTRSGAGHGRELQIVRDLRLDDGFHWDVTTRQSPVVTSVNTIWRVPSGAYVNIYPDGYVRAGSGSTQQWGYKQSARADAKERA